MPADGAHLTAWPGADRRAPGRAHYARLVLRPLSQAIERAVEREVAPSGRGQEVLDVVLSTQTLEHVPDPHGSVREMHRVLRPGGVLLLSVPFTSVYHPVPEDFWRWTQEGLVKLVRDNGEWSRVGLTAAGGTAACFGYLLGTLVHGALGARWQRPLHDLLLTVINAAFGALDAVVPLHYPRRYTLISSFLAVARKA